MGKRNPPYVIDHISILHHFHIKNILTSIFRWNTQIPILKREKQMTLFYITAIKIDIYVFHPNLQRIKIPFIQTTRHYAFLAISYVYSGNKDDTTSTNTIASIFLSKSLYLSTLTILSFTWLHINSCNLFSILFFLILKRASFCNFLQFSLTSLCSSIFELEKILEYIIILIKQFNF